MTTELELNKRIAQALGYIIIRMNDQLFAVDTRDEETAMSKLREMTPEMRPPLPNWAGDLPLALELISQFNYRTEKVWKRKPPFSCELLDTSQRVMYAETLPSAICLAWLLHNGVIE